MPSSTAAYRLPSGPWTSERNRPESIGRVISVTSTTEFPSSSNSMTSMRWPIGVPPKPMPMMPTTMLPSQSPHASPVRNSAEEVPCDQPLLSQTGAMASG